MPDLMMETKMIRRRFLGLISAAGASSVAGLAALKRVDRRTAAYKGGGFHLYHLRCWSGDYAATGEGSSFSEGHLPRGESGGCVRPRCRFRRGYLRVDRRDGFSSALVATV